MRKITIYLAAMCFSLPVMAEVSMPGSKASQQPASAPASAPSSAPTSQATAAKVPAAALPRAASRPAPPPTKKTEPLAKEPRGSLAVVNLGRRGAYGWLQARAAHESLSPHVGGWAKTPSVAAALAGDPAAGVLPDADVGRLLGPLLERLRRKGRPSIGDLFRLGQLLGVDYLLLMRVRGGATSSASIKARIFSVHRQEYAPQGFERGDERIVGLKTYVKHQVGVRKREGGIKERWWVWAIAGAVAVVTLVLSALNEGDDEGTLKIRVKR